LIMITYRLHARLRTNLVALLLALATAGSLTTGCGDVPKPADPAEARQILTTALDAWKGGGQPTDVSSRTPPVHVLDRDWEAGVKVADYQLEGDGRRLGAGLQYPVSLTLQNAAGKTAKKRVVYVVNTGKVVSIARQDVDF